MFEKGLLTNRILTTYDYSATILSQDEDVSIMLNEADHIVETCTKKGLNLILAYDTLNAIDNEILSKIKGDHSRKNFFELNIIPAGF